MSPTRKLWPWQITTLKNRTGRGGQGERVEAAGLSVLTEVEAEELLIRSKQYAMYRDNTRINPKATHEWKQ
jgi:hypothetical protein